MVPYINPANEAPGVQTGHAPGVISSHRLIMEKTEKISETMGPTAYIFSMWQCLVVPYINPASQAPGAQTGLAPGVVSSHYIEKNLKHLHLWNHEAQSLYI